MMRAVKKLFSLFCCAACCYAQTESLTIGPGDLLHVKVLEAAELEQSARVTDTGTLPLILGGNVKVAGLTPSDAALVIGRVLVSGHYILAPHVSVTLEQAATQTVTIMGQVHAPGSYAINTPRPILDVLALAGGLTDLADRRVTIQRHGTKERVEFVDANSAKTALDASVTVFPGDTIVVPKADVVYILGDVNRPGGIAMVTNDSKLSAVQAISLAGGTPPSAVPSHARLIRKQADGSHAEIPLNLSAMQKGKEPDTQLQADDIVYIPFSYTRNMAVGAGSLVGATSSAAIYRF
ncbi:MAG TPA: polysaccharide biosynthesis/export family protein [Acidobacteriaceae bacterium]|jgi:polysaccharide export outer membrane protein|nr:polysaccharide biosynthesis/export family protein [Acidobacteriaceae bacterium]